MQKCVQHLIWIYCQSLYQTVNNRRKHFDHLANVNNVMKFTNYPVVVCTIFSTVAGRWKPYSAHRGRTFPHALPWLNENRVRVQSIEGTENVASTGGCWTDQGWSWRTFTVFHCTISGHLFFSDAGLIDFLNSVLPHAGSVTRAHCGVLVERKTSFLSWPRCHKRRLYRALSVLPLWGFCAVH